MSCPVFAVRSASDFASNVAPAVESTAHRGSAATLLKTNHLVFVSSRLLLICLVLNVLMSSHLTPARAYDRSIAKATDATHIDRM